MVPGLARPEKDGNGYEIVAGHRRTHGSELAGLEEMPFIVREMTDHEAVSYTHLDVYKRQRSDFCASLSGNTEICSFWAGVLSGSTSPDADSTGSSTEAVAAGVGDGGVEADVSVEFVSELFSEFDKGVDDAEDDAGVIEMLHPDSKQVHNTIERMAFVLF